MAGFEDRQKAQEAKFALDAELRFRAEARRNKLLGFWVAELIGRADKDAYAAEVIAADFEEAGDDDVVRKVSQDISHAGKKVSEDDIRAKMAELLAKAQEQVLQEG